MTDHDLDNCIQKIAGNDMDELHRLYEHLRKPVYLFALSILKDSHTAEDVTQNVFIQIMANAHRYQARGKARAWIFTIARNLIRSEYRKSSRMQALSEEHTRIAVDIINDDTISQESVLRLLEILKPDEREIVVLHIYGGLQHKVIARALELPYAQVRWKYAYALKKLRRYLEAQTSERVNFIEEGTG